ncbi:MAG: aminopeptidase N, partial [Xanthomonadales bacterium]|nr:aminopeptidase N [Xanthomonadales bacterium]
PADWEVVSVASGRIMEREGGTATWVFAPTPRISTYVFSLHAGPYQIWESRAGDVPIRLLARQSLAPHVEVDEWFEVTRAGLDFFADYFAMPYPFGKYDQLIVPDFNIGAMENVAAVTFNERTVQRTESNRFERESRAEIILHEMAHMWFGNLVTKDWWNGLWLNESFATLMAYFALVSATEFEDAWHGFFTNEKPRAYFKDSRVTTHPIEVPVDSTDEFFSVFDAITYQKGSSVLKQLAYFVGEDNFREGVRRYLAKHAYGNTVLDDFIDAQAEASGRDLAEWTREWLFTAGFNELQAEFTCREGAVSGLHIEQRAAPANPTLRTHRFQVAVYDLQDDALALRRVIDAELSGARSALRHLDGWPCPALVFPNHNDWTYARVILSDEGVAAIDGRLHTIAEPLARSMFIQSLFDMARDGRLRLGEYVRIAAAQSVREPNLRVLDQLTRSLSESVALLTRLRPEAEATRSTTLRGLEFLAWDQLEQESDRDRARLWFDLFVAVAESPQARARLRTMLDGRAELPGLVVGPEQRWEVVIALAGLGVPDVQQLIDAEALRDPSDQGAKYAIAADAARPEPAVKRAWLDRLLDPDSELGLARQRYAIAYLFPAHQTRLQEDLLVPILDSLGDLADADPYFLSSYVQGLLRPVCTKESVAAMAATLERGSFHPTVELFLREAHQADEECLALRPGFN